MSANPPRLVTAYLDGWWRVIGVSEFGLSGCDCLDDTFRRIVEGARGQDACAVVIAHSRPDDDMRPSPAVIEASGRLDKALLPFGIRLYDHLIFGSRGEWISLKRLELL